MEIKVELVGGNLVEEMRRRAENLLPVWPKAAAVIAEGVDQNFTDQGSPSGPWPPSLRALRDGGLTLVDTENLRRNATNQRTEEPTTLRVGTDVPYGDEVTRGKGVIPPRPFLEIGEATARTIAEAVFQYITRGVV